MVESWWGFSFSQGYMIKHILIAGNFRSSKNMFLRGIEYKEGVNFMIISLFQGLRQSEFVRDDLGV